MNELVIPKHLHEEFKTFLEFGLQTLVTQIPDNSKLTSKEKELLRIIKEYIDSD